MQTVLITSGGSMVVQLEYRRLQNGRNPQLRILSAQDNAS